MARLPLTGKVAGATRGAGRGIARMLGEAGAVVYCTGRSSSQAKRRRRPKGASPFSTVGRTETIEQTAALVDAAGGRGVPVRCDHADEAQVAALFARVADEAGRLDVLVDDVWGGDALIEWGKPFWELDVDRIRALVDQAIVTHLRTIKHAAPLMVKKKRGLIVEVTDGDGAGYRFNLAYDLVKTAIIRLAFAMSEELRPHGVTALAVTPGFLRSEAMLEHFGVTESTWRDGAAKDPNFAFSETPAFVGRAVAALAADREVAKRAGRVYASWTLAREYGFTDTDGRTPDWGAHRRSKKLDETTKQLFAEERASAQRYLAAFTAR